MSIEETPGRIEPAIALWAPGSAVLAVGEDTSGERAVAVWQISPDGHPTGAWGVPEQQAHGDPTAAHELLVGIERRALVAVDEVTVDEVVARLTGAAGVTADRWWSAQRFSPSTSSGTYSPASESSQRR